MTDILTNILLFKMKSIDQQHGCYLEAQQKFRISGPIPELEIEFYEEPPGESHTHESLGSTSLGDSDTDNYILRNVVLWLSDCCLLTPQVLG